MPFDAQPTLVGDLLGVRPLLPADSDALYEVARDPRIWQQHRVVFLVGPDNRRSQRALEKIGAVRAGTRPDAAGQDSVLFELRRP